MSIPSSRSFCVQICIPIIILVFVTSFLTSQTAFATRGIECGAEEMGSYVAPKKGIVIDVDLTSEFTAVSPNEIYKLEVGNLNGSIVINITENQPGGEQVLHETYTTQEFGWGFSPDDHRFVIHFMESNSIHKVQMYNLRTRPATRYDVTGATLVAGGEAEVRFSRNGNYLFYAAMTGVSTTKITLADTLGNIKHDNEFTFQTYPDDGGKNGMAHWGFSPDLFDRTFVYGFINGTNSFHLTMVNLETGTIVRNDDILGMVASFWRFSPPGDMLGTMLQESQTRIRVQLHFTEDGTSHYNSTFNFEYVPEAVTFESNEQNHVANIGGTDYVLSSNTADSPCPDIEPPSWPSGSELAASEIGFTEVTLEWTKAIDNIGVEMYRLYQDGNLIGDLSDTTYQVTDLNHSTDYTFTVQAGDAAGNWTTDGPTVSVTTPGDSDPPVWSEDARLAIRNVYEYKLDLIWEAPEDAAGVSRYAILQNGTPFDTIEVSPNSTYLVRTVYDLVEGEPYTFEIKAGDLLDNWTLEGLTRSITMDFDSPPSWQTGSGIEVDSLDASIIKVHWLHADDNIEVYSYEVLVDGYRDRTLWSPDEIQPPENFHMITDLEPETEYEIAIVAQDEQYVNYQYINNASKDTLRTTISTLTDMHPPKWREDANLSACDAGDTWMKLYWSTAYDNIKVTQYIIYVNGAIHDIVAVPDDPWDEGGEGEYYSLTTFTSATGEVNQGYLIEGLEPYTEYEIRVEAGDAEDNWSEDGPVTTARTKVSGDGSSAPIASHYSVDLLLPLETNSYGVNDINEQNQIIGQLDGMGFLWEDGELRELGSLGSGYSQPLDINEAGQVTGRSSSYYDTGLGFFWDDGEIIRISGLDEDVMYPEAINDSGYVAGSASRVPLSYYGRWVKAYRWNAGSGITDLGSLGGENDYSWATPESHGNAINKHGQIVGDSKAPGGVNHAFLWDPETEEMQDLGTLGGDNSRAVHINDAGQIIGTSTTTSGESHAFLWTGAMHDLGSFGKDSYAYDLNEEGHVVGHSRTGDRDCAGSLVSHAFIYTGSQIQDMGTLGGLSSSATDINNHDQVVGWAETPDGSRHAFLWANGVMFQLDDLNAESSYAVAINDSGWIIINATIEGQGRALLVRPTGEKDNTPPDFVAGLFQNPVLPSYFELYLLASESVVDGITGSLGDEALQFTPMPKINPFLYKTPLQLEEGQHQLHIQATDIFSNDTTITYEFSVGTAKPLVSTLLAPRAAPILLEVPENAVHNSESVYLFPLPKHYNADNLLSLHPDIADIPKNLEPVSLWQLGSTAPFNKKLTIRYNGQDLPQDANFYRSTKSGWEALGTYMDDRQTVLWAFTDSPGIYGIFIGGETPSVVSGEMKLEQNYPNPFSAETNISYTVPITQDLTSQLVALTIYDLRGQVINQLVREQQGPQSYHLVWDGTNQSGIRVASGAYFLHLSVNGEHKIRKMIYVK